jgi:microsomal dipeptidase-like Zn-dependent dipeptidase
MKAAALGFAALCCACGQTWDFEDAAFRGWTQTGKAFAGQPLCKRSRDAEMSSSRFSDSHLGGDYWQELDYPLGQHGNCVVSSQLKIPGAGTWSLTSPEFTLPAGRAYLSFRVSGAGEPSREFVELQVRRGGDWTSVQKASPYGTDQMRQEVWEIADSDRGLPARIRIVDDSPDGHINVDYICVAAEAPPALELPVWGYGDYHTHPMTQFAFGSNDTRHIIWGDPGRSYDDYVKDPCLVDKDIPHCHHGHGGGYLAEAFINNSQLFMDDIGSILGAFLFPHKRSGGPEFADFPSHVMGAHEQMHITMIRRNYDGGLRLMVALAVDNWGAAFLTGSAEHGVVPLVAEKDSFGKQLQWMKDQAGRNSSWMGIARSPAEARDLIRHNKLAVILGVEADQLGQFDLDTPDKEAEAEAKWLWSHDVRAVTPIHAVNNLIGGPAILNAPYNWLNDFADFIRRNEREPKRSDIKDGNGVFFEVNKLDCRHSDGQCVLATLDPLPQLRLAVGRNIFTLFERAPEFVVQTNPAYEPKRKPDPDNPQGGGYTNKRGLESFGRGYLGALMSQGMIIDTAHMSDKSVDETHTELAKKPGYPAIISHAHFRAEGLDDEDKSIPDYLASEYDISDTNLKWIADNGGVVGPFLHQARVKSTSIDEHISTQDDCGNSSKGYAFAFHYGQSKAPGAIGIATDMTFIPVVSPRFGDHACEGFKQYRNGAKEMVKRSKHYQPKLQKDPVVYQGVPWPPIVDHINQNGPMKPFTLGERRFDFNYDGLAHYGMVPDMLQDLKNVDLPKRDRQALFESAEAYLKMWEKVERAARQ